MGENTSTAIPKKRVTRYFFHTAADGHPVRSAVFVDLEEFPEDTSAAPPGEISAINKRNGLAIRNAIEAEFRLKNLEIGRANPEDDIEAWRFLESQLRRESGSVSYLYKKMYRSLENASAEERTRRFVPTTLLYNYVYLIALMDNLNDPDFNRELTKASKYDGFTNLYIKKDNELATTKMAPSASEALNLFFYFRRTGVIEKMAARFDELKKQGKDPLWDKELYDTYRAEALKNYYVPYLKEEINKWFSFTYKEYSEGRISYDELRAKTDKKTKFYNGVMKQMGFEPEKKFQELEEEDLRIEEQKKKTGKKKTVRKPKNKPESTTETSEKPPKTTSKKKKTAEEGAKPDKAEKKVKKIMPKKGQPKLKDFGGVVDAATVKTAETKAVMTEVEVKEEGHVR